MRASFILSSRSVTGLEPLTVAREHTVAEACTTAEVRSAF